MMERIKRDTPDFVLIDLFMPGLDAIGVINATRRSVEKAPLFFVKSAFSSPTLEREVLQSGASYFTISPFNPAELLHMENSTRRSAPSGAMWNYR